jgi:hypothetical protein
MKTYTEDQLIEIFERLIEKGFGGKAETELLNDMTLEQLEAFSLGVVN